uniref:Ulp1 protease family, C-terminal catalytic domain containing protein n=1 Tax=Solanum tuberosum TaxID=4113 RepID=M1DGH7_SOLTU
MPNEAPTPPANVSFAHLSSQVRKDKSVYPDIEELKQHMKDYVDSKFEYLVNLIKAIHSEMMNSRNREDDKQPKFFEGTMNEDASYKVQRNTNQSGSDTATFDTLDSTTSGTISSETREVMHTLIANLGRLSIPVKPVSAVNSQELTNSQSLLSDNQLPTDIPITEIVVRSDTNTPLACIRMPSKICKSPYLTSFGSSEKGKEVMKDVIRPNFPFEGCEITNRAPSYLIDEFIEWVTTGLLKTHAKKKPTEDKYRAKATSLGFEMMDYVVAYPSNKKWFYAMSQPKNCWTDQHIDVVFYYFRKKSKLRSTNQYRYTTVNCLFSSHINNTHERYYNNVADDDISTQEHIDRAVVASVHKRSITNVMKGFSIPAALPWHLVDDVYISINCDGKFHWVLAIVELNKRLIHVYNSSVGTRKQVHYEEIKKLSRMLPSYLLDSGFFEKNERTIWPELDAYKDKQTGTLLESHIPFNIEYVQDIMQQEDDNMDYGLYVATFAEFLSDQLVIPPDINGHLANYLRNRYAALLWRYGSDKFKGGYISENDDPPKPKGQFTTPTEQDFVNID